MATFYIENENGNFFSEDGKRRFMRLTGKVAYDYLSSDEGKNKHFMKTSSYEDGGELEWIEVPEALVPEHCKDKRRAQYVSDCIEESGFITISFYATEDDENSDVASGEELIADPNCDVEMQALRNIELDILRKALETLTDEEKQLIYYLFLAPEQLTVREIGEMLGIHFVTVSKRKNKAFQKIKKYFENTGYKS